MEKTIVHTIRRAALMLSLLLVSTPAFANRYQRIPVVKHDHAEDNEKKAVAVEDDPFAEDVRPAHAEPAIVHVNEGLGRPLAARAGARIYPELTPMIDEEKVRSPSKRNPADLIVLLDQSNSTLNRLPDGTVMADAILHVGNGVLDEIYRANSEVREGPDEKDTYVTNERARVKVFGYSGVGLHSLIGKPLDQHATLAEIGNLAKEIGGDEIGFIHGSRVAQGTPRRAAYETLANHVRPDVKGRMVMLIDITDGKGHDGAAGPAMERWAKTVIAHGGTPLATKVFMSTNPAAEEVTFPDDAQMAELVRRGVVDAHGLELYSSASVIPPALAKSLKLEGEGRRLFAYNVKDVQKLAELFRAGSSMLLQK